ncbi:MAG: fibronectin type III domain-containing protein [Actinomycetota bacterium]
MNSRTLAVIGASCAAVAAVAASAAGWTAPPTIISVQSDDPAATVGSASYPSLAVDADGTVTAVWAQRGAGEANDSAWAARMVNGAWGAPVRISSVGDAVVDPSVAVRPSGDAVAAWRRGDPLAANSTIEAVRFTGGRWTDQATLAPLGGHGRKTSVAFDSSGVPTAMWTRTAGASTYAQWSRFAGSAWSTAADVPGTSATAGPPTVVPGGTGQVVAAWIDSQALVTTTSTNGIWGGTTTMGTTVWQPWSLDVNAQGAGVLAWYEVPVASGVVRAARLAGGTWGPAETVSPVADNDRGSVAAIDGSGNITVAWARTLPGGASIVVQAARSTATGWTAPVDIGPIEPVGGGVSLAIAANAAGQVTVVWSGSQGGLDVMRGATWTAAGGWGASSVISRQAASQGPDPVYGEYHVVLDPLGRATAAWLWRVPSFMRVEASRLEGVPGAPTAASGTAGDASVDVRWTAPGDDGSSAITGYRVTASPGGAACTATATTCRVTGLANGTGYTFTVTATNAVGTGPASAASGRVTPSTAGPAPRPIGRLRATLVLKNRVLTTTGPAARGVTRVTQRATAKGRRARAGSCRIRPAARRGATRTYRCTMRLLPARWTVTTATRDRVGVLAQSVRVVRVR